MKINKNLAAVIVLFAVVLINYANIFPNEFVWDDDTFITSNRKITSLEHIPYHFTHESRNSLWRPLRETFYIFTYLVWGLNTVGYHLNALLLHTLITVFVFFIFANITKKKELALFSALLFAAHPIHTARVTNMTGSFDMLGLAFFLAGFYFFIKYRQGGKKAYYFYTVFAYLLALLSSEEAITFVGILLLYDICFTKLVNFSNIKRLLKEYIPYIALTLVYAIIHALITGRVGRTLTYFEDSFYITLLNSVKAAAFYIKLLILPLNMSVYQSMPKATSILSIPFLISFFALMLLVFAMAFSFKKSKTVFFSFGWFFITMFLFYNFIPKSTLLADRYLYFPSFGFCLLLGYFVFRIGNVKFFKKNGKIFSVSVLLALVVFYSAITIRRNMDWRDEETLLKKAVEASPISTNAHWALAKYYKEIKNYELAEYHLHKAINLSQKNYIALELLGVVYAETNDYEKAVYYLKKAIETAPAEEEGYYRAHNDLGLVYSYMGDLNSSVFYLKKAIQVNPGLSKAHNDIGTVYAQMGNFDDAIEEINKAIEINPYEAGYYNNLAVIYEFLGDKEKADELLLKALEIGLG
ncbi:tetratricopeptide repeat protein [Candidatus Woesearchaeota archaeon]|nr:tetratricopeptide repeat protein [Candidatus Woesearchaeota archaeon]